MVQKKRKERVNHPTISLMRNGTPPEEGNFHSSVVWEKRIGIVGRGKNHPAVSLEQHDPHYILSSYKIVR